MADRYTLDDYLADTEDEYPPEDDEPCYLGHPGCYDTHDAERRADEADWEEERSLEEPWNYWELRKEYEDFDAQD